MTRYDNLRLALDRLHAAGKRNLHLLEVGTYDGKRAVGMLTHWHSLGPDKTSYYFGFDLWEKLTPEMSRAELSKSRLPPSQDSVWRRLQKAGFACGLWGGNTRETLPRNCPNLPPMDLVFVDGGHSLATVASDWAAVSPLVDPGSIALLDDYYEGKDDYGCGPLVRSLAAPWTVALLDPVDVVPKTGLRIRMARVTRD